MASKTLTLTLGGKERTLCFGKFGFIENMEEVTGGDPFQYFTEMSKDMTPKKQFELVALVTYCGLLSQCDFEGKKPDFTKEDVYQWVRGIEISEALTILNDFNSAIGNLFEPGEPTAQMTEASLTQN